MIKNIEFEQYWQFYEQANYSVHYQDPRWLKPIQILRPNEQLYGGFDENGQLYCVFIAAKREISGINKLPLMNNFEFVSRRGVVMDYSETNISLFSKHIKQFMRENKIVFTNITPNIVVSNNKFTLPSQDKSDQFFQQNGWQHHEFFEFDGRIPNRECIVKLDLPTLTDVEKTFKKDTMRKVRKAIKNGVSVEKVNKLTISDYYYMFEETGARDGFSIQVNDFYKQLLTSFADDSDLYIAKIHLPTYRKQVENKKDNEKLLNQIDNDMQNGEYFVLGLAIILNSKQMSFYESGATTNKYRETFGNYLLHYQAIADAYNRKQTMYNFGSVGGSFEPSSELYGLYYFKTRFSNDVTTYPGEYELFVNKFQQYIYSGLKTVLKK